MKKRGTEKGNANDPRLKNLLPPWPKGVSGNPAGMKKGTVRRWDAVMRDFFYLAQNDPDELEKRTGIKLPTEIKGKDAQAILIQTEFIRSLKGDSSATNRLMDRMDGLANQKISLEGNSIVELIKAGYEKAKEAQK